MPRFITRIDRMSKETPQNPRERMCVQITNNATLEASRFCIEQCDMLSQAQEMALVATAITGVGVVVSTWEQGEEFPTVATEGDQPAPGIVMKCKGPRRRFVVAGELVCRGSAEVDTA